MKSRASLLLSASLLTALLLSVALTPRAAVAQAPTSHPVRVRAKLSGFDLSTKSGKSANQIGGASRDLGTPRIYAPASARDYALNPTFHWATPDGAAKVTFRLSTINGIELYKTTTSATSLAYPADAPPLKPGMTYRWTIVPENDMLGGAPAPVTLMIVDGAERAAIQAALASSTDPASVFVDHRIWYDAIAAYNTALDKNPDNQTARLGRATLFNSIPATQSLADADWKLIP